MKQRHGFVSNSSSSSFIIGYGTVKNAQLFQEYLNHHKLELGYDLHMYNVENGFYDDPEGEISGGNVTSIYIPEDMRNETTFTACIHNNEGDGAFAIYENGEFIELDWDRVDYDYFDEKDRAVIDLFSQPFIEHGEVKYGVERNG